MERSKERKARPLVQVVSKPVVSPFHDGTKCFVRDLTNHVQSLDTAVIGGQTPRPPELRRARVVPLHSTAAGYQPGLRENLRTLSFLIFRCRADIWHFAFAPNPRSSSAARLAKRLRQVPTLQTVVSPPRTFDEPERLLFGDIVVTQSRWTRDQFRGAFGFRGLEAPRLEVIHPVAPELETPTTEQRLEIRAVLGVEPGAPLLVYPGDLEMSRGSARVAELVAALRTQTQSTALPTVVFAYRNKTPRAAQRKAELAERLGDAQVRFIADTPLIHALLAEAALVLFPVDDLFGKVDVPIVLLEALRLGTRVLVTDEGPLRELEPAARTPWEARLWVERIASLLKSADRSPIDLGLHEPHVAAKAYERLYEALLSR